MFGIQQAFEGVQWIYLNNGSTSLFAGYSFLFFALVVWPIYVPTIVLILDKKERKLLKYFLFLGIIVGIYFLIILLTQTVSIQEVSACVNYNFNVPLRALAGGGYALSIFAPLLISSKKVFRWFGILVGISAIISWIFFSVAFASVWCFFAAAISFIVFLYIKTYSPQ